MGADRGAPFGREHARALTIACMVGRHWNSRSCDRVAPSVLSRDLSQQLLGVVGAIYVARFGWLFWRVISGPGDDNPMGMAYFAIALLALVPALGLVAHKPLGRAWRVSAFVIDTLITLALIL